MTTNPEAALAREIVKHLKADRDEAWGNLPEGWFEGPWGKCGMCSLSIREGEVGFRTQTGTVLHSRCMVGEAAEAPPDKLDEIKDEIKELLNG